MRETNEFAIEWVIGDKTATATVPEGTALNNRLNSLMEKYPTEVQKINSELFHFPTTWVKLIPPRQLTDEQREKLRDRFKRFKG